MSASVLAQYISAFATVFTVIIFGAGYYLLYKVYQRMTDDMERQRIANGRPQVIVTDNYGDLPHVSITIKNNADGAAQNISFEFSAPVTCSDGHIISELPYFRDGMAFLSPDGEVTCYWDDMHTLIPHLRERNLTDGIDVITRYQDLAGESYETTWKLNPFMYSENRWVYHRGVPDLVEAVEKLSSEDAQCPDRYCREPLEGRSRNGSENASHKEGTGGGGGFKEGQGG